MFLRWIDDHHVSRKDAEGWLPIKRLGRPEEIAALRSISPPTRRASWSARC
jgi:hypothetical protein